MKQALKFSLWLCICLVIGFPQCSWSQELPEITVVTEDWRPYNYRDGSKIKGFSTEIVQAVLDRADAPYLLQLFPWSRSYKMALEERNVLIYTIARTEERENLFKWVGPLAPRSVHLFKLKKRKDMALNTLEDAKKYKIGVVRADAATQLLLQNGFEENRQLDIVATEEINQRNLFAGKIDLITGNELSLAPQLKDSGLSFADLEQTIALVKGDYYMAFSRTTDDKVVNEVRKALEEVRQEGLIEKIKAKYFK